jgi:hypothetical protein
MNASENARVLFLRSRPVLELSAEPPVPLQEIADYCRTSFPTVWRWALKGLPGPDGRRVRLDALRVGGRWVSSWAALQRFAEATTPQVEDEPARAPRPAGKRQRAAAKAERELKKLGL